MAQESRFMTDIDKTSVCKRMNKTLILSTSLSPTKPLFLVAAAFNLNNNRSPTWQKNMMAYLSFRSNLEIFLRSQNLQWGAVLYETTCFRNEIEMVITDILLSRLSDHTEYTLVAMFTEELEKLPLVASILLPYLIPVYGISIATDKYSTVYHNYHHSLRVSNVIQNKRHVIRKKMQQFLEQSAYGEVTIFRGADLTLEENSELDKLVKGAGQQNICVFQDLVIPNTKRGWQKMTLTLNYMNISSLCIVYSHFKTELTQLMNFVHAIKFNKTVTWVFSRSHKAKGMTDESTRYGNIIYVSSTGTYSGKYFEDFLQKKASTDMWVRLHVKDEYLQTPIGENINIKRRSKEGLDKAYSTAFKSIGNIFKGWIPSQGKQKIYEMLKNMTIANNDLTLAGIVKTSQNGNTKLVNNLTKNIKVLKENSTKLCQSECEPGFERVLFNNLVQCCWRCDQCQIGYFRTINMTQCQACPLNTMSDTNRNQCFPYRIKSFKYKPLMISICSALTGLGLVISLMIAFVFFRHHETPIVKSSDKILLTLHLTSHIVLLLIQLAVFVPANTKVCYVQVLITSSLWSLSSSVTLVKTQKFLRIFNSDLRQTTKEINLTKHFIRATILFCQIPSILLTFLSISTSKIY